MWPDDKHKMDDHALDRRKTFIATTSVVILFTVFVQGGLSYSMLKILGIETNVDEDALEVTEQKPKLVKFVLSFVNKYFTPHLVPKTIEHDSEDGEDDYDDSEGDVISGIHSVDSEDHFETRQISGNEGMIEKLPPDILGDKLLPEVVVGTSTRHPPRTASAIDCYMTPDGPHPSPDLRRSYSEGARPDYLPSPTKTSRIITPDNSTSLYSFVRFKPNDKTLKR
jgi:hypothetical protein